VVKPDGICGWRRRWSRWRFWSTDCWSFCRSWWCFWSWSFCRSCWCFCWSFYRTSRAYGSEGLGDIDIDRIVGRSHIDPGTGRSAWRPLAILIVGIEVLGAGFFLARAADHDFVLRIGHCAGSGRRLRLCGADCRIGAGWSVPNIRSIVHRGCCDSWCRPTAGPSSRSCAGSFKRRQEASRLGQSCTGARGKTYLARIEIFALGIFGSGLGATSDGSVHGTRCRRHFRPYAEGQHSRRRRADGRRPWICLGIDGALMTIVEAQSLEAFFLRRGSRIAAKGAAGQAAYDCADRCKGTGNGRARSCARIEPGSRAG
jgi:hypothetical protein